MAKTVNSDGTKEMEKENWEVKSAASKFTASKYESKIKRDDLLESINLTLNGWAILTTLRIIYHKLGFDGPSAKEIGYMCELKAPALPASSSNPTPIILVNELTKKKGKAMAIDEPAPKKQNIEASGGGGFIKDVRKLSKKDSKSRLVLHHKEGLSASLEDTSFYALKDINENTPIVTAAYDNQKKTNDVANKLADRENKLTQAEIARDDYKAKLDNAIIQLKELDRAKKRAKDRMKKVEEAENKLKAIEEVNKNFEKKIE
ncbi:hypothetical protein TorRG33x02_328360 [Trema orientale]|uniref:Uncharacterized protein n=1 Tax=Trema orientale TaxID=63057 RepID=A0A2P5B9Z5_TREOI|nr:hypothetical protein TorRG33x02_328360 [Trema orientale]